MATNPFHGKNMPIIAVLAICAIIVLIVRPGYVFPSDEGVSLPRSLFPFLFDYRDIAALSNCPPIFLSEVSSNRNNSNISESSRYPAENAIDNDLTTRWVSSGNGSSLTLPLGSQANICDLGIAWYLGSDRAYNFAVAASNDSSSFVNIYNNRSSGMTNSTEIYNMPSVNATALRLIVNGSDVNSYAHVSDLKIYGHLGET